PDYLVTLVVENNHLTDEFIVNVIEVRGVVETLPCPWKVRWRDQSPDRQADRYHITKGDQCAIEFCECSAMGDGWDSVPRAPWRPFRIRIFGVGGSTYTAHAAGIQRTEDISRREVVIVVRIATVSTAESKLRAVRIRFG